MDCLLFIIAMGPRILILGPSRTPNPLESLNFVKFPNTLGPLEVLGLLREVCSIGLEGCHGNGHVSRDDVVL